MKDAANEGLNLTPGYIKEGRTPPTSEAWTRGSRRGRRRRLYREVVKAAKRGWT